MLLRCPALICIVVAWPFVVTLSLIIAIQSEVVVIDDVHLFHLELEVTNFGNGGNSNMIFGVPGIAVMRKSSHTLFTSAENDYNAARLLSLHPPVIANNVRPDMAILLCIAVYSSLCANACKSSSNIPITIS
ncbi:uncharacterized protein LACBIDRAFT_333376 [Laccaria bicolor S238N-H82]|uniref:Predicted protein n=1 Tax=Laccaria bicolor (strain S238N-H82 / ATCC MYA-4686) TaxID=486041 RepID=B0DVQ1_LACBS|nr:uncharacterized protein LACBIDRAFT_333372 [Laccaria bicolor S238N-H82]XP_001888000.1 uncharacterized protein LACBIDRAFT_333376 [Laccaria bicolor S238N-H82]EDR01289.1 predicted protein [Laccaria bicolor S238N-H82]EDR01293.1 predicted protein [Laccaria bicolor S238N-H82]|eukprot:XP_001887996.1 predicted protein [Laccaria bicolor S238N-H82]